MKAVTKFLLRIQKNYDNQVVTKFSTINLSKSSERKMGEKNPDVYSFIENFFKKADLLI